MFDAPKCQMSAGTLPLAAEMFLGVAATWAALLRRVAVALTILVLSATALTKRHMITRGVWACDRLVDLRCALRRMI